MGIIDDEIIEMYNINSDRKWTSSTDSSLYWILN